MRFHKTLLPLLCKACFVKALNVSGDLSNTLNSTDNSVYEEYRTTTYTYQTTDSDTYSV